MPFLNDTHSKALKKILRNWTSLIGLIVVLLLVLMACFAPHLAPKDPRRTHLVHRFASPSSDFILGADYYGRDVLSRAIFGSRVSLMVGFTSISIAIILGVPFGVIAGYYGGRIDEIIMRITDILMAFPLFLLGLTMVAVLGSSTFIVMLAIGIVLAPRIARLSRGPTLSVKEKEYIEAAKAIGLSDLQIIIHYVIPNIISPVAVASTLFIATAIRIEASLSFLGLGVQPPIPTWGNMIRDGVTWMSRAPWLVMTSGFLIMLSVLGFNLMGDGLRDIIDPK